MLAKYEKLVALEWQLDQARLASELEEIFKLKKIALKLLLITSSMCFKS